MSIIRDISFYKTVIFDFDGVILDSNRLKSKAFYEVTKSIDLNLSHELVEYNKLNGGISRYKKFGYFRDLCDKNTIVCPSVDYLCEKFKSYLLSEFINCNYDKSLIDLRPLSNCDWFIISGGKQDEISSVLNHLSLSYLFQDRIFGSPKTKEDHFQNLIDKKKIIRPALFIGDSVYDFECSYLFEIDFLFKYEWTEFNEWYKFCTSKNISYIKSLFDLLI